MCSSFTSGSPELLPKHNIYFQVFNTYFDQCILYTLYIIFILVWNYEDGTNLAPFSYFRSCLVEFVKGIKNTWGDTIAFFLQINLTRKHYYCYVGNKAELPKQPSMERIGEDSFFTTATKNKLSHNCKIVKFITVTVTNDCCEHNCDCVCLLFLTCWFGVIF